MYKVIVRNRRLPGLIFAWDLTGESQFKTLKGAKGRQATAARKYRAFDTAILTPSGDLLHITAATHPAFAKPAAIKKRKLTPRV
jgi:hypothetical protein